MSGNPLLAAELTGKLRLPLIAGPMFIASTPALVVEQCKAGIIGSIPALNARSSEILDSWIAEIENALAAHDEAHPERPAAPYAVNLVAHRTNDRLAPDFELIRKHRVPLVIVSLAAPADIVAGVHEYGGLVFNDVISNRHARICADAGADGLIAICSGAGGHTGNISPFALVQEIRQWWEGPLALAGCIATGRAMLAAQVMGADFAYIGSLFLAAVEANTSAEFKDMIVASSAQDVIVTNCFTGVNATFLRPSIEANGLDPKALIRPVGEAINIKDGGSNAKAWRDIWSAGQGIGAIDRAEPAAVMVDRLEQEYRQALLESERIVNAAAARGHARSIPA